MAESSEYVLLDTKSFDTFMAQKESLVQRYHQINTTYDDIVKTLLSNWVGEGARASWWPTRTCLTTWPTP